MATLVFDNPGIGGVQPAARKLVFDAKPSLGEKVRAGAESFLKTPALPAIAGTVAGFATSGGTPMVGIPAATLAGAAGEGFRQIGLRAVSSKQDNFLDQGNPDLPQTAGDAAGLMLRRGAEQGVAEAAGRAVGAVAKPVLKSISGPLARRAMGLQKRFLTTPFARGRAARAAETALEQKIIPALGSPAGAMQRAGNLANRAGSKLTALRESVGPTPIDSVYDGLDTLRESVTKGRTGGVWDVANRRIDDAQETLLGLLNKEGNISLNDVAEAKKRLGQSVNWLADNVSQGDTKQIVMQIEAGISDLMGSKGGDVRLYRKLKRLYGDAKLMEKGLNNELALQQGNDAVSLSAKILGAGGMASPNPLKAPLVAGAMEFLKRRGAGIGANLAYRPPAVVGGAGRVALGAATTGADMSQALINALRRRRKD